MKKVTRSVARSEKWFQHYLNLGRERSIQKLAEDAHDICERHALVAVPRKPTLESWAAIYGWNQRARVHDRGEVERTQLQGFKKRANSVDESLELAVFHANGLHDLLDSGLIQEARVRDEDGERKIDVSSVIRFHVTAYAREMGFERGPRPLRAVPRSTRRLRTGHSRPGTRGDV